MIEEKYKWLYSYTLPCTRMGDEEMFWELLEHGNVAKNLRGDYSRGNVRGYFLTEHNLREIQGVHKKNDFHRLAAYLHLAIPYKIRERTDSQLFCELDGLELPIGKRRVFGFCQLESATQRGVLKREDEIIITHAGIIVESCKREDVARYFEQLKSLAAA